MAEVMPAETYLVCVSAADKLGRGKVLCVAELTGSPGALLRQGRLELHILLSQREVLQLQPLWAVRAVSADGHYIRHELVSRGRRDSRRVEPRAVNLLCGGNGKLIMRGQW